MKHKLLALLAAASTVTCAYASETITLTTQQFQQIAPHNVKTGLEYNTNLYSLSTNLDGVHERPGFLQMKGTLSYDGKTYSQLLTDYINMDVNGTETWVAFDNLKFVVNPDNTITGSMDFWMGPLLNSLELTGKYNPKLKTYTLRQVYPNDPSYYWGFTVYAESVNLKDNSPSAIAGTGILPYSAK